MSSAVTRITPPVHHVCTEEHVEGVGCSQRCSHCPTCRQPIVGKHQADHHEWHADFCLCNWAPDLRKDPRHECHPCHRTGCAQVKADRFPGHLIRCCPIQSAPPISPALAASI
jgi:hypothetical protein